MVFPQNRDLILRRYEYDEQNANEIRGGAAMTIQDIVGGREICFGLADASSKEGACAWMRFFRR
jgi:hypothetical protein